MSVSFNEDLATADELWDWCTKEYASRNFITKRLIDGLFATIGSAIGAMEPGTRILEVGCGAGESARRLHAFAKGRYFEASEYDKRYVQKLQGLGLPFTISQESVYDLKRADNSFDCVIMMEVLEHLEDPEAALRELFRVARKYVVVSVPNEPLWRLLNMVRGKYWSALGNTPGHINHWTPWAFASLLRKFGRTVRLRMPMPWTVILAEKVTPMTNHTS